MFKKMLIAAVLAVTMATPLAAAENNTMSDAEREVFRAEVRAYLMDNPEVLLEAIAVLEERQVAELAAGDIDLIRANAEAIFDDGFSYIGGNLDGDITIVEFMDYRCAFCKRAHPEVMELLATDGNIRYIIKEFPILGPQSDLASQFAISVLQIEGNTAYSATYDTLMTMRGSITKQGLSDLSDKSGFDTASIFETMNSEGVKAVIDDTRALALRLQINGTPSFVFETEMLRGYAPLADMRQVVADLRAGG